MTIFSKQAFLPQTPTEWLKPKAEMRLLSSLLPKGGESEAYKQNNQEPLTLEHYVVSSTCAQQNPRQLE